MIRYVALLSLMAVAAPSVATAKTNMQDSVEWLCHQSEIVAYGTLTAVDPADGGGKSRDLVALTLEVTRALKGLKTDKNTKKRLHFSVRMPQTAGLDKWKKDGTELVVFLRRTAQGYSRGGLTYDLWPVRESKSQAQMIMDPAAPSEPLLVAASMKRVQTYRDVARACDRAAKAPKHPGPAPLRSHKLSVPHGTEAFQILYSGSACYLFVPSGLFPKATRDN